MSASLLNAIDVIIKIASRNMLKVWEGLNGKEKGTKLNKLKVTSLIQILRYT